jgi:hypothetical protein
MSGVEHRPEVYVAPALSSVPGAFSGSGLIPETAKFFDLSSFWPFARKNRTEKANYGKPLSAKL